MFSSELEFLKFIESKRTVFTDILFEGLTMLGEETLLVIIVAFIYYMFDKNLAKKIAYIVIGSLSVNCIIKNYIKLPRPFSGGEVSCVRPETATGYSFPSGHTQNIASWSSAFAIEFRKLYLWIIAVIITLLVAFSRVYLGAHYPSDTLAGAILGFALSLILSFAHSHAKSENKLYAITGLILTPFTFYFLCTVNPLYENIFKAYGMMCGLVCASLFEQKYVSFGYNISLIRKIIRVIIAAIVALTIKKGFENIFTFENTRLLFIADIFTYAFLVFAVMGFCPYVYKKLNF